MDIQSADALIASFRRITNQIQKVIKHLAKYHLDMDKMRNELTTVVLETKIIMVDLSKNCTSKTQMKIIRRLQNHQEQPHPLLVPVSPMPPTFDLDTILTYAECLLKTLLNLISTRMTYMTDINSSVYRMCHCFEYLYYQPTMYSIQMCKSNKGDAATTIPPLATTSNDPLKAETVTRRTNTERLSVDGSGDFEDGSCTSTAFMLKPIFDRQISRKLSAPEDDGPCDRSALPLNCHRPVNNGAVFIPVPTVQLLGCNAIGSLPPLALRPENQDVYQKPSNNINSVRRRDRCNIESNSYPPPHYHYHHHDRPVQTTTSELNGLRKVDYRPTRYLWQHNNGPQELRYGGPPNRPYQQEQFNDQPSPVKHFNHPVHTSTMHVSSTAMASEHREQLPTSRRVRQSKRPKLPSGAA